LIDIEDVAVFCNVLHQDRESALRAPRGAIRLVYCESCGHLYNAAFEPKQVEYCPEYENSLHFSPKFHAYAQVLADHLVKKYALQGRTVVEIGCGKGDFLNLLCKLGENEGIGFDPSYKEERIEKVERKRFRVIPDYYSQKYAGTRAHMVVCRHVLEHVEAPRGFLESLRSALGPYTVVFFEVPNVMYTLKDLGIWDLIYEHCGYFSEFSLYHLFDVCGFAPVHLKTAFGDQFICLEALAGKNKTAPTGLRMESLEAVTSCARSFSEYYRKKVKEWGDRLDSMNGEGKKAIIWGAGSKGVTFANIMREHCEIEYVVDINPHKQKLHVPGTGQQVVGPDALKQLQPDVMIIMNTHYEDEIREILGNQNISCDIISA
jgi:SAM-dependent methyltransferase